jgi:hypothetical protein
MVRGPIETRFDDAPLRPGHPYVGAIADPTGVDQVLSRFATEGEILWIDTSGHARGTPKKRTFLVRAREADLATLLHLSTRTRGVDLVILTLDTTPVPRDVSGTTARRILQTCRRSPWATWIILGVGHEAWRDEALRTIACRGTRLPRRTQDLSHG